MKCWMLALLGLGCYANVWALELKSAAQDIAPKFMLVEQEGVLQIGGLCVEVMRAVESLVPGLKFVGDLGPSLGFLPVPRIELMLERGDLDVAFCLVKNQERLAKYVIPDIPIYRNRHVVAVRAEDPIEVSSLEEIRALGPEGFIATPQGSATASFLKEIGGLRIEDGTPGIEGNLQKLLLKRVRFFYYTDLAIETAIKRMGLQKRVRILPTTFYVREQFVFFSPQVSPEVVALVTQALQKLQASGELRALFEKYR